MYRLKTMTTGVRPAVLGLLGLAALGLSGCLEGSFVVGSGSPELPSTDSAPDSCGRTPVEAYIGEPLDSVPAILLRDPKRVYTTGAMLTMDYRLDRLNVEYHPTTQAIVRVSCG